MVGCGTAVNLSRLFMCEGKETENEEAITIVQKFAVDRVKRDG